MVEIYNPNYDLPVPSQDTIREGDLYLEFPNFGNPVLYKVIGTNEVSFEYTEFRADNIITGKGYENSQGMFLRGNNKGSLEAIAVSEKLKPKSEETKKTRSTNPLGEQL